MDKIISTALPPKAVMVIWRDTPLTGATGKWE